MTTKAVVIVWLALLATDRALDVMHHSPQDHQEDRR